MNRIILIGNGFDLAHGLPTRYEDFINWYWKQRLEGFSDNTTAVDGDALCKFIVSNEAQIGGNKITTWKEFYEHRNEICPDATTAIEYFFDLQRFYSYRVNSSLLLDNICKAIKQKGWVDIENVYYRLLNMCRNNGLVESLTIGKLNEQLACLKESLVTYLRGIQKENQINVNWELRDLIYEPIKIRDVSVAGINELLSYFKYWLNQKEDEWARRLIQYGKEYRFAIGDLGELRDKYQPCMGDKDSEIKVLNEYNFNHPDIGLLPERIMFLNFNYTNSIERYVERHEIFKINYIHGQLGHRNSIIFGYGDELDKDYNEILNLNDNEYLCNMKSVKYLESGNYRDMLSFIESAPYQVYIMGHSCGNSDRTLLNTLFEHRNCVTIKPFYYKKEDGTDNYLDLVQNISRNFTDMKLMRDRVVNKTFCSLLPQCC